MSSKGSSAKHLRNAQWLTDEGISRCGECNKSFGIMTRKHHCRRCGNIFCGGLELLFYSMMVCEHTHSNFVDTLFM